MELPKGLALLNVRDLATMIEVSPMLSISGEYTEHCSGMSRTSRIPDASPDPRLTSQYPLLALVVRDVPICFTRKVRLRPFLRGGGAQGGRGSRQEVRTPNHDASWAGK